jgi:hypothetical protein
MLRELGFFLYSVVALLIYVPQAPNGIFYIVTGNLAATFQAGQPTNAVIVTPLDNSVGQRVWLDSSSHILLFVLFDFVVDDHERGGRRAIYNTC